MSLVQMSLSAALMIVAIIILRALTIERFPKDLSGAVWIALLETVDPVFDSICHELLFMVRPNLPAVVEQSSAMESPLNLFWTIHRKRWKIQPNLK